MTRICKALILPALLLMLSPIALSAATPSAPKDGDMAVSFNVGFARAFDDDFEDLEPVFTGSFEYYATPRISWRGLLGVTSFDADFPGSPSVDATFLTANILYNWEGGVIHPYVTGGAGFYKKNASSDLPSRFDETAFGVNAGGGIDWFLGSRWALEFEGTFHGLTGEEPDTLFLGSAGIKFWF
jgi:opacity protein-like surface antigen